MDKDRQRRPSYFVWRELNYPARIDLRWKYEDATPAGFQASVARKSILQIPSYPLKNYTLDWELRDATFHLIASGEKKFDDLELAVQIEGVWKAMADRSIYLSLRLSRPNGFEAGYAPIEWHPGNFGGLSIEMMKKAGMTVPK